MPKEVRINRPYAKAAGVKGFIRVTAFLLVAGLVLVGWVAVSHPGLGVALTSPEPVGIPAKTGEPSPAADDGDSLFVGQLEQLTQQYTGTYGVYVESLADGKAFGLRQNEVFPAASLMKLPIMLSVYQAVEQGKAGLDDVYVLQASDQLPGTTLSTVLPGSSWTYRQLLQFSGQTSDNSAALILLRLFGREALQEAMNSAGMGQSDFDQDETTPEDVGAFFSRLYNGSLISQDHRDELLSFLSQTIFDNWMPADLPEGVRVAHKVGIEDGAYSDGGIIFGEKPFVLVVMSQGSDPDEAPKATAEIAKMAYGYEEGGS